MSKSAKGMTPGRKPTGNLRAATRARVMQAADATGTKMAFDNRSRNKFNNSGVSNASIVKDQTRRVTGLGARAAGEVGTINKLRQIVRAPNTGPSKAKVAPVNKVRNRSEAARKAAITRKMKGGK